MRTRPLLASGRVCHRSEFLALGRKDPANDTEEFCMTVLALRLAAFSNGVSKLHGAVSRSMWNPIWKGLPESEVPIGHITNGVHFRTWVSLEMNQLYDRYLGPKWREEPADAAVVETHASPFLPANFGVPTRDGASASWPWRGGDCKRNSRSRHAANLIDEAEEVLTPDALTIGFGRRFATYKRATLLLHDPARLARILNHRRAAGSDHFRRQSASARSARQTVDPGHHQPGCEAGIPPQMVFLENYDMSIARYMVQGCDIWLNTPLRPLEASGTSGMKAQANGVLNVSTLDGWWDEAWQIGEDKHVEVGWSIGKGETYQDPDLSGPGGSRSALRTAGTRNRSCLLRPSVRRASPQMDRSHEELNHPLVPGIQHAPHGDAVCGRATT